MNEYPRYGVKEASAATDEFDILAEELRLLGFTTLSADFTGSELDGLSSAFDHAASAYAQQAKDAGYDLAALGEQDVVRVLPSAASEFWAVVFNQRLHKLLSRLLGDHYILNQANGLINRAHKSKYSQSSYHRDLPYQHFVSSRPLAINALFALDEFTLENGATRVIPASHHLEAFPADESIRRLEQQIIVPRGTFIVLDAMVYHAGATNLTAKDRRAVNHVFTIPLLRQQLHLPSVLAGSDGWTEWQKRVLGFGLDEYRSVNDWLDARRARQ